MKTFMRLIPVIGLLIVSLQGSAQSTITSFLPTSGGPGTVIEITGTNLSGVNGAFVGPSPVASFTVNSPTSVTLVVGNGAYGFNGDVAFGVSGPGGGVFLEGGFNYTAPPLSLNPIPQSITKTSFIARWEAVTGISAYYLDVSTSSAFLSYVPGFENKAVGNVTSSLVDGLTQGTQYYYRVRSLGLDIVPPGGASPTIPVITSATDLIAPVALAPTLVTASSFTANWQPAGGTPAGPITYFLETSSSPSFTGVIPYPAGSALSFNVTSGLLPGMILYYRVSASDDGGASRTPNSSGIKMATLMNPPAPGDQAFLTSISSTSVSAFHQFPGGQAEERGVTAILWQVATDPGFVQQISGSPFSVPSMPLQPLELTGLTPATKFFFRFAYQCLNGVTDYGVIPWFTYTSPAAPILLTTSSTNNAITVTWTPPAGASSYLVDVSPDNFVNYQLHDFTIAAASSMTITGLSPGTTYKIRLRAKMTILDLPAGIDPSVYSNVKTKSTLQSQPIAQPSTLNFSTVTSTGMTAAFTDAAGPPDGYIVLYKAGSSPTEVPVDSVAYTAGNTIGSSTVVFSGSANTFSPAGLTPGTQYFYDIFSYSGSGNMTNYLTSAPLEGSKFTLSATPSAQPTNITVSNSTATSVDVSFTAASGTPTGYLVIRKSVTAPTEAPTDATGYTAGSVLGAAVIVHAGSATSFTDTGLTPGTLYFYAVFAFNGSSNTFSYLRTSPLTGSTSTLTSVPVLNTSVTPVTQTSFQLSWAAVTGATDYSLDVSADDFATFVTGYQAKLVGNVITTSITSLSPGTTYKARLRAVNSAGTTTSSTAVSALTIPANPVLAAATAITASQLTVSWNAITGATGYLLDISTDNFNNFVAGYNGFAVNGTSYIPTSLNSATTFQIRVRASNGSGASGNSNTVTATTLTVVTSPLAFGTVTYSASQLKSASQTLSTSVSGGTTPYTVVFKHRKSTATVFTNVTLTATTASNYSVVIDPAMLDDIGMVFRLDVTDGAGGTDSETGTISVLLSPTASPAVPFETFGGTDESWNLFSIPYDLDNKSIAGLFSNYDPERYEFDWKVMRYRTGTNDYVNFNTGQVKLGEAYWFNAKESAIVQVGTGKATAQIPFVLSLAQGWNLVGNPFPMGISWNKVRTDNPGVAGVEGLQVFNGAQQSAGNVIAPFGGGFVWSDGAVNLNINPATAGSGRTTPPVPKIVSHDIDESEWMMPLTLLNGGTNKELGGFGMHKEAQADKDRFDAMAVPRFVKYTDMSSEHQGYFYPWFSTDVVQTGESHTGFQRRFRNNVQ